MRSRLIALDLGGTVEDSWDSKRSWFAARGIQLGPTRCGRGEIIRKIGGKADLYEAMLADVYSEASILSHGCTPGAATAIRALAQTFVVALVTSRTASYRETTVEWLRRRALTPYISNIAFLGDATSKVTWCEHASASVLVDDDVRHFEGFTGRSSIVRIHYSQSGRTNDARNGSVLCAYSWRDVLSIISRTRFTEAS